MTLLRLRGYRQDIALYSSCSHHEARWHGTWYYSSRKYRLFIPGPYYWGWRIKPVLFVESDSAVIGRVNDPDYFERVGLKFGYVRKADGSNDSRACYNCRNIM